MYLDRLRYLETDEHGNEWLLDDFTFGKINLFVGQNATGKSRTLNVMNALGKLLSGEQQVSFNGCFNASFKKNGSIIEYILDHQNGVIREEKLTIDNETLLQRGHDGIGTIYAKELNLRIKFQVPDTIIASVAKKDSIQHPFFEQLFEWGKSLRFYQFGTQLGKDHLAIFKEKDFQQQNLNLKDTNSVVAFLKKGLKEFGPQFTDDIKNDINEIGFNISEISVKPFQRAHTPPHMSIPECIYIKEKEHKHTVDQIEISQGLFRALSLFIQLRFSEKFSIPSLILIDDIGEGLDYERSTKLISSIVKLAKASKIQLIMTTNDRFVMNNVPLEYWAILTRNAGHCTALTYRNSKNIFDRFELTGLSNFDFFSSKYYQK